ncbi:MAG: DUF853 family protein [Thermoguttaceae bacterium]|nr:DUF853 family protein [Thermoguttaceae bacterium]
MFTKDGKLYVAHAEDGPIYVAGSMANRHGLIAGATGTGKTVSLQVLAETFCQAGVPCFMADMKGDLSGIAHSGTMSPFIEKRCNEFGMEVPEFQACPTRFFDVYGVEGHPMRTTISDMGPLLLARLLGLNDTQSGILNIVFKVADERKLLLIDMKDLRAMLDFVAKNAKEFTTCYGNISPQSVGAIQRSLLQLEGQGADKFFGEPAFNIMDLLQTENGKGVMNVLAADKLMSSPKLYSTFLLWLLSELYTTLPEAGDLPLPKLIFFFDEAHTLFKDTAPALVEKIEQVVRLVRSKGVGVWFVSQLPTDIPEAILGQLGNRVQHALRAFTPKDQKGVRAAAETFRVNPKFDTKKVLLELGTGEALVSMLDQTGTPAMVRRAKMLFPSSQIGPITPQERSMMISRSRLAGIYDTAIDRTSAYEDLTAQAAKDARQADEEKEAAAKEKRQARPSRSKSTFERILGTMETTIGRQFANAICRSILGSIFKKK